MPPVTHAHIKATRYEQAALHRRGEEPGGFEETLAILQEENVFSGVAVLYEAQIIEKISDPARLAAIHENPFAAIREIKGDAFLDTFQRNFAKALTEATKRLGVDRKREDYLKERFLPQYFSEGLEGVLNHRADVQRMITQTIEGLSPKGREIYKDAITHYEARMGKKRPGVVLKTATDTVSFEPGEG